MEYTSIRVSNDTWKKLQRLKARPSHTNEEVVKFLIENYNGDEDNDN